MRAAAALSEHPLATHALGECVGRLLELGGQHPDLVALWATDPHAGALEDVVPASQRLLAPRVLVGASADGVLGGARRVEAAPALSMLAVWGLDEVEPVRWHRDGDTMRHGLAGAEGTVVLLADPFDVQVGPVLDELALQAPGLSIVGGALSAARHRGGNRFWLDGEQHRDGAVGVRFGPREPVRTVLCPGTRAVGEPLTVTEASGRAVVGLGGEAAIDALTRTVAALGPDDQAVAARSVELGLVDRPDREEPTPDQVRVLHVRGVDRGNGALLLDGPVHTGATAQFHLRDPRGADEDLCDRLAGADTTAAALVCSSTALGLGYHPTADHQSVLLSELLPTAAVAGMSSVEEYGPVAGVPGVVPQGTSLVLFG